MLQEVGATVESESGSYPQITNVTFFTSPCGMFTGSKSDLEFSSLKKYIYKKTFIITIYNQLNAHLLWFNFTSIFYMYGPG